jgi:hypothetical protein
MRKFLLVITLLLLAARPLLAQSTPPYPDTSATGTVAQMIQKLSRARVALDDNAKSIAQNQRSLDALNATQAARKADADKLGAQSKKLVDDFKLKVKGFIAACGQRMREESVEYTDCLHSQTDLGHEKEDIEHQNNQLAQEFDKIKQDFIRDVQQQLAYQVTAQNLANWKSQVESGIRSLEAAIDTKCKPLGNCPKP